MNSLLSQKLKIILSTILISGGVLGMVGMGHVVRATEDSPRAADAPAPAPAPTANTAPGGAPPAAPTTTPSAGPAPAAAAPQVPKIDAKNIRTFPLELLSVQKNSNGAPNAPGITGTQNQAYLRSENPLVSFILQIINFIALSIASLSFLAMVIAGFIILISTGNATTVQSGISVIINAAIGLVVSLSAYYIVAFVQSILFETVSK